MVRTVAQVPACRKGKFAVTQPSDLAQAILAFKLADADLRRADELAAKARSGVMTSEERQHLENYLHVGRIVEFMKARALLSLKAQDSAA